MSSQSPESRDSAFAAMCEETAQIMSEAYRFEMTDSFKAVAKDKGMFGDNTVTATSFEVERSREPSLGIYLGTVIATEYRIKSSILTTRLQFEDLPMPLQGKLPTPDPHKNPYYGLGAEVTFDVTSEGAFDADYNIVLKSQGKTSWLAPKVVQCLQKKTESPEETRDAWAEGLLEPSDFAILTGAPEQLLAHGFSDEDKQVFADLNAELSAQAERQLPVNRFVAQLRQFKRAYKRDPRALAHNLVHNMLQSGDLV